MVLLLAASGASLSSSVSIGAWQLDSDLNATAARAVLAQLTFTPQADGGENAWLVSSSAYLLSDGAGGIGPQAVLAPNCVAPAHADGAPPPTASPVCSASSDLYYRVGERLVHVGRLRFHPNSLFDTSSGQTNTFSYPNTGRSNQSLHGPDVPLTLPQEWLWVIAAAIVLVLTLAFVLRNRD